jgi:multimeric flavodoxin WrbA
MKGILLDGEVVENEDFNRVREILTCELQRGGCQLDAFRLREMEIAPCQGCFGCWVRNPGACLIEDDSREIVRAIVSADLLVLLTPLTFGGYSSELKKGLDRGICLISPFFMKVQGETHHKPRYDSLPRLLGIGVTTGRDSESGEIFESLVQRNSINFHSPAYSAAVVDTSDSQTEMRANFAQLMTALEVFS